MQININPMTAISITMGVAAFLTAIGTIWHNITCIPKMKVKIANQEKKITELEKEIPLLKKDLKISELELKLNIKSQPPSKCAIEGIKP